MLILKKISLSSKIAFPNLEVQAAAMVLTL